MLERSLSGDNATTSSGIKRSVRKPPAGTAEKPAALFNYTEEEWLEIEAAVQVVRKGPLPKKIRKWLAGEARWYLANRALPNDLWWRTWEEAVVQTEKTRQLISGIAEHHLELLNRAGYSKKRNLAVINRCYGEDLRALARIRDRAKEEAKSEKFPTEGAHYGNPKLMYRFKVLLIWTFLGGELRVSRHPRHGNIQGPLARFFGAVTVPVMGESAPSPESLPDIIRQQKRFEAFEATPEGKLALKRGFEIRNNHWTD
jgi:hypothetical protein